MSGRKHKKKQQQQQVSSRQPSQLRAVAAPQLPAFLQYQISPATQQADATIAAVTRKVQALLQKPIVQGKAALEDAALPLFGALMQLQVNQIADVVRWSQTAMLALLTQLEQQQPEEPIFGIPADVADELCAELETVMEWLDAVAKSGGDHVTPEVAAKHHEALAGVAEIIDDYALEEVGGDGEENEDEDEDEDEDEEDEEPDEADETEDEPPLHIVDPDAVPLLR